MRTPDPIGANPSHSVESSFPPSEARNIHIQGLGVGPGIGIGTILTFEPNRLHIPQRPIALEDVTSEQQRVRTAAEQSAAQIGILRERARAMPGAVGEELDYLLDAYQQMLQGSRLIKDVLNRIEKDLINAEAAVSQEMDAIAATFADMDNAYLAARAEDVRDIGGRLIRALNGTGEQSLSDITGCPVLVADTLSPANTALLRPESVAGLILERGGADSHTAIMARSLGLPAVVGASRLLQHARNGDRVCFDGRSGLVVLDPGPDVLAVFEHQRQSYLEKRRMLDRIRDLPATTRDGMQVTLMANMELVGEIDAVLGTGAEGVGLLRTEFMFMNRPTLPDEDEQFELLRPVVERMAGKPVIIRTLDVGGDKLSGALGLAISANPALGLRAIRLSLQRPEFLEAQFAAILRVACLGPVQILLPMVGCEEELLEVRAIYKRVIDRFTSDARQLPDPIPPLGIMIEVPAAALIAEALAKHCDFFSIGTNDLVQYTLAIDRADETVAHLYDPLHPAVLRLIRCTVNAAQRAGIPVAVCGEMAGDPCSAGILMGMGVSTLSMAPNRIPLVKNNIRRLTRSHCERQAIAIMEASDRRAIHQITETMLIADGPDAGSESF